MKKYKSMTVIIMMAAVLSMTGSYASYYQAAESTQQIIPRRVGEEESDAEGLEEEAPFEVEAIERPAERIEEEDVPLAGEQKESGFWRFIFIFAAFVIYVVHIFRAKRHQLRVNKLRSELDHNKL